MLNVELGVHPCHALDDLAYVNHAAHQGDNGRVLGLNNARDYHHRHFMGKVQAVEFAVSYEATRLK